MRNKEEKKQSQDSVQDKINLDYDWNSEYGDGDIPDVDKNEVSRDNMSNSTSNEQFKKIIIHVVRMIRERPIKSR